MNVIKIAAFSDGHQGGNPAGVVLTEGELPSVEEMRSTAHKVGFSETVFAARLADMINRGECVISLLNPKFLFAGMQP